MLSPRRDSAHARVSPPRDGRKARRRRAELTGRCLDLAGFLRGFDETVWAGWLERQAEAIAAARPDALEALLAGYTGVAGIGDLYLCPEAGHRLDAGDEAVINEQVLTMLGGINASARALQDALPPA